jgi:hypothetical protein
MTILRGFAPTALKTRMVGRRAITMIGKVSAEIYQLLEWLSVHRNDLAAIIAPIETQAEPPANTTGGPAK